MAHIQFFPQCTDNIITSTGKSSKLPYTCMKSTYFPHALSIRPKKRWKKVILAVRECKNFQWKHWNFKTSLTLPGFVHRVSGGLCIWNSFPCLKTVQVWSLKSTSSSRLTRRKYVLDGASRLPVALHETCETSLQTTNRHIIQTVNSDTSSIHQRSHNLFLAS